MDLQAAAHQEREAVRQGQRALATTLQAVARQGPRPPVLIRRLTVSGVGIPAPPGLAVIHQGMDQGTEPTGRQGRGEVHQVPVLCKETLGRALGQEQEQEQERAVWANKRVILEFREAGWDKGFPEARVRAWAIRSLDKPCSRGNPGSR
jgi:hypothetical protein